MVETEGIFNTNSAIILLFWMLLVFSVVSGVMWSEAICEIVSNNDK